MIDRSIGSNRSLSDRSIDRPLLRSLAPSERRRPSAVRGLHLCYCVHVGSSCRGPRWCGGAPSANKPDEPWLIRQSHLSLVGPFLAFLRSGARVCEASLGCLTCLVRHTATTTPRHDVAGIAWQLAGPRRRLMNITERIEVLTARIAELEASTFDNSSANSWWLLSNGILCARAPTNSGLSPRETVVSTPARLSARAPGVPLSARCHP